MKQLLFIFIVILTLSCHRSINNLDYSSTIDKKIDSVLLFVSKTNNLYNNTQDSNTLSPQKLFPLVKTIKFEGLNLTFQFRQGIDCHSQFEIILCYNDSLIYGIPFIDNYYYNKFHGDTTMYQNKLSFEKELNNAIGLFSKCYYKKGQKFDIWFSQFFIETIMDNMTKYSCRKIVTRLGDLKQIRNNIQENIKRDYFQDKKCKQNALKNIIEIENENKDYNKSILLYHFYINNCIYRFDFQTQPQNGKFVKVKVINKECFFDLII